MVVYMEDTRWCYVCPIDGELWVSNGEGEKRMPE